MEKFMEVSRLSSPAYQIKEIEVGQEGNVFEATSCLFRVTTKHPDYQYILVKNTDTHNYCVLDKSNQAYLLGINNLYRPVDTPEQLADMNALYTPPKLYTKKGQWDWEGIDAALKNYEDERKAH